MALTVGTAGHVDHGKTTLVRALTGKDTDRLPEEHARGISIDLGYAPLALPDGRTLSLVDVPGHERFVRTMVAGATGIDLFLLVVDAAEGARPQTHEHLAILRLLGVEHGVVAVTKADAVDSETLELAVEEAQELVPEAQVVAVSGVTGAGLDELRTALGAVASETTQRSADFPARLYVDRVFTLAGHRHDRHRHPLVGDDRRGRPAEARAGRPGRPRPVGSGARHRRRPRRGGAARGASACRESSVGTSVVETRSSRPGVVPSLVPARGRARGAGADPDGARLSVHHGTSRIPARVVRVGDRHAQLRLAAPVVAARGDRVVLRGGTTVGGGRRARPRTAAPRRTPSATGCSARPIPPRSSGRSSTVR